MLQDASGRNLWIIDETGAVAPVNSRRDIQDRERGPCIPDWWVAAKDADWTPPEPAGRSLLSMGAAASGAGGGTKIGAGHKPQGYDEHGRYTGSGGAAASLTDGTVRLFGQSRQDGAGPGYGSLNGVQVADSGRVASDAPGRRMTPKDYSPVPDHDDGGEAFYKALRFREASDNTATKAQGSHSGLYQMGKDELHRVGATDAQGNWTGKYGWSKEEFLASRELQDKAVREWHSKLWDEIQTKRLDQYTGKTINGVEITPSGMIAAAHLKGVDSGLKSFLTSGGRVDKEDGLHTKVSNYLKTFGGYPVPYHPKRSR